ncbi:MAG: cation diffusion facilitator family transporter [Candidatus Omnitrophota bacterium]
MTIEHHIHHRIDKLSRLKLAIFLTAFAMVVEFSGGFLSNSLALISDAGHMLTHLFALGMSYFAILLALKPVTKKHTYGLYRAEVLAAFINGIVLIFISGYIAYEAILRFITPREIKIYEMLFVAVFGLIINGITIFLLAKISYRDLNIRSALLHELGDTVSSIAVVTGAVLIFYTGNYVIDSVLSFIICVLIVIWAVRLLIESSHILLEAAPRHLDIDVLVEVIKSEIPGIYQINHVHVWSITSSLYALTAEVVIEDCHLSKANELLVKINEMLKKKFNIEHTNIQFECLLKKGEE